MNSLSSSEENYLKAIYKIQQQSPDPSVSTKDIAAEMGTTAASVTDMIKKLSDKGLLDYEKYYGVSLSKEGQHKAISLIRKHRLWEVFLVEKLGLGWEEVHEIAEQLEHVQSNELVDRLDAFLNYPKFDPHGDPIPNETGRFTYRNQISLAAVGHTPKKVLMLGVRKHTPEFLRYLNSLDMRPGSLLHIKSFEPYDQAIQLSVDDKKTIWVSKETAQDIIVKP